MVTHVIHAFQEFQNGQSSNLLKMVTKHVGFWIFKLFLF